MAKLVDKHIIFIACLVMILTGGDISPEPIVITLLALIATELTSLFYPRPPWIGLYALYCVGCLFLPPLLFFLPVLLYDFTEKKNWWGYAALLLFFTRLSLFTEVPLMILWWCIAGLSTLLSTRTRALFQIHLDYISLRDDSVENESKMRSRNKELLEKQDYEIHVATLSERNRIAREIHDNVGHMLSRSILQMGALMTVHKKDEILYEQLSSVNHSLNEAMNNIRESVHDLHDESIDLKQSILESTAEIKKNHNLSVEYDMTDQVPRNVKYCMIAIVKEAMSNIIRHSNADKVSIMLREHPGFYQLVVEDNGKNITKNMNPGIGLNNMQERVEALGGTINFNTEKGFQIMVFIRKGAENEGNRN